ncbi:MAG: hypothetical protein DI598_10530 [Pseudopedobacter saltans]|uniref:Quinol oxidase subunit 4 n=1 Tax=Pseudopedobacter saltans TaxID=151895 RepID=A0A2W5GX38_9SPHI|nr:MAG: hypothetical protein DI598_10530 [Pseudopedobacter saltans]
MAYNLAFILKIKLMKRIYLLSAICISVLLSTSCTVERQAGRSGKIPPGQAKKMNGSKSARDYAPGHN